MGLVVVMMIVIVRVGVTGVMVVPCGSWVHTGVPIV